MSKFKHLLFFIIFSVVTNFAFSQLISVPFDDGFIGTRGNNAQDADLIKTFTTLGINKSSFIQQTPNGVFVTSVQGNDIPGTLRLYFSSPKSVTISGVSSTKSYVDIAGSIVWRNTTGSTVNYFGFLPDLNTNISFLYSTNLTFNITRPTSTTGSNIGNLRVDRNFTFTDNTSQSGNAAGVLDDLNSYRLTVQSLDPSGPVTVNSLTTSNQNPTITGNATLNSGESLTVTVNGVVYSVGDGNLSISGNNWSLVIPNSNLLPYATYSVEAIITNSSGYILTDLTSNELVITPPTLTTSGTLKTFTTCSGCVISPQSFTVSGSGLSSDLIVTAPTGVEVSTISNASYSSTVTLTPNSGTVSSTTVYVRLTNNSTAANSGVISVTTTGATSKTVSVTTNTDNGLNFDGVNDNVRLPISVANGLTNFTFEAWVNPSIQNTFRRLFDFGIDVNKYMLFTIHNGKPFFAISNGTYPQLLSNTTIPLNTWTHLAVVINDATDIATIYINGHADVSGSMPFNPSSLGTISAAYLGTGFYAENFGGKMDEVRIWNTARTASEIANNYLKELVGNETGLQAYYNFNQGVANGTNTGLTTLYDKTSAVRNSTSFNNFALTGSISNYVDGFIPSITESNNSSNVAPGYTLQLTNALTGGTWSSTNTNFATVDVNTGLVTGVANGTLSITYSICGKTAAYTLNVVSPVISTSGTLKTFTTCSGCTVTPQSFTVSGSNLGSNITVTAPTGVEVSTFSNTSYASTISITPTSGTISSTTVYVRLINSALSANSGVISVTADGATSQTVTLTTNADNALDFDGNDYVDIPDDNKLDFTTSFTIEGWVYPKTANATQVVFGKVNDLGSGNGDDVAYMLRLNNGKFQIEVGNGTVPSKYYAVNNYDQNKWQHVAMVYSLGTLSFYFNGVLQASHSTGYANNSILTTSSSFKFGVYKPAFAQYFNGTLDNFRLWNVARTQSEISANMNSEIIGTVPGLVASYTFNNGIGNGNNTSISDNNAIEDFTNNNLNGNLVGFAKNGTTSNFVSGFIPNITATGNASSVPAGNTLQLSNALSGGTWSSTNTNLATVDANTGLVTGVASGTLSISYTVCDKTVSYALTVVMPIISTNGTLYTFSTCSGCNMTPQSFSVSGTNLGAVITVTAPTGFVVSNASNGTYSSTLSLSPTNGTLTSTSVYVKLTNNAVSANSGVISITSSGATSQSIAVNTNTDNALSFDGSDAINIGQPIAAGSSYTIEAWINYKGSMTENNILSSTGNVFWIYQDKLNAGFTGNFQVVTSPNVLEKNKWNHVAVTLDDPQNLMNLYINGNLVASASTNLSFNGGENLYIGSHYVSNNTVSYFNGDIDEVRVWNTARTLAQIQNNMYKELVGFNEPNLRAYYNFNDGINAGTNNGITNLTDASLTAYNSASLSSFTLAGNTSNFVPGYIPAITGTANANVGATSTLSNTLTGGTWSSSNTNIATVNSSTGVVTAVAAGSSTITYSICDKIVNTIFNVTLAPPASLSYTSPNVYTVGTAITPLNPTSSGGPITTYSIGPSLPAGLTIDPNTGIISGTPSAVSTQTSYTVTGTNASGTVTATVVITVNVAPPASLSYTTPNVYPVGSAITSLNPTSTGGPITTYSIGPSLPAGLTIDPNTGIISGTPSAVSTQTSYTVTGTNASGTITATVVITVNVAPPASLSYTTPNVYTVGTVITPLSPTSTGGPITTYSIGPSLPAGLTIDPNTGVISGTPTAASAQTTYIVTGTNASGSVTATVVITVNSGIAPQPQGSLNAVDYGLLATDTVKLKLTTSNGVAPFTLILSNNKTTAKDTISNLTPVNNVVTFLQKRLDTTKVFTIFKLIDANNNTRSSGFTKDTTIVNVLKPKILLTLKAEPTIKQADNSFKTRLLLKVKNSGDLDLRNVQVNANLSSVFPVGINYVLDSVRVIAGNFALNPNYTGAGTATSASSTYFTATASSNGSKQSLATLDQNYLFNNGVSLNKDEEGEIVYYVSIGATTQNVTLKLQFETAGDGVLVKNDGTSSAQETTSKSDDGTNIAQHPDVTNQGLPMPTYVPLFPNEKIGGSLAVSSATAVTGGYQYHFIAKIKNYGNVNLDSIRIQYNFNNMYPAPDQASLIGMPTITRGNIVYNTNVYDGYSDVNLFNYGGDLQVGDSATYEYDLKVTTNRTAYTWPNYFVVYGRSINSGVFINDTSMSGTNPDPNNDNDPAEQFFTKVTINFTPPAPPTVENKTYVYGTTKPANIGGLVKSTPAGTIPVWCDQKTAACSIIPPATPTEIGKYIFALRSYDTTTLLYSEVLVYDTVIIKPPVPIVMNKKYIIGNTSNPANVSNQVTGMSGSVLNYFKNASLQSVIPTLGTVPGVTRYTTSQTVNGIESDTVGFTVTMLDPKTMLHLRKIADEPKLQSNSTFNITYTFIVTNRTDEVMTNVLVADNLQNTFPSPTLFDVVSVSSTGGLVFNNAFNGKTDIQLLKATSSLAAAAIDTIRLTVNLQPKGYSGTVNNVAVITATTPYGNLSINSSSTSFANETVKSPTPAVIPDLAIDIPEAFSPNRDGVNDRFVILKPFGTTLELEVYNRWGNVVYYNANYNNEWDGRGTNNFIGQDLMDGGYYYTLKAKSVTGNSQIFKGFVLIQR